jgi:hypothetical protein
VAISQFDLRPTTPEKDIAKADMEAAPRNVSTELVFGHNLD